MNFQRPPRRREGCNGHNLYDIFVCRDGIEGRRGGIAMDSQKIAGILATIVALVVIAGVVIYGPKPGAPNPAVKTEAPKQPEAGPPAVKGPVIRDGPN